jgi:hypothetical protein
MSVVNTASAKKWAATMSDLQKKGYLLLAVVVTLGLSYYYYSAMNRPVAGVLWFIGGSLVFFYYWLKWFTVQPPPDPDFMPGINACPDYLSVIPNNSGLYTPTSSSQYLCVDYVGVSRNGGIKKMDPAKISSRINDPAFVFSVDPTVDFADAASKAGFVRRLTAAGLTYNSVGDSSLPTQGGNSNGAPSYRQ